jgi:hypothetical protein
VSVRAAIVVVVLLGVVAPLRAQAPMRQPVRRMELDAGGGLLGGAGLGSSDANLRANAPGEQMFRFFTADTELARAPLMHIRAAYAWNQRFVFEGGVTRSRPDMRARVTNDAEGAPSITLAERVDQYFIDGSVLVMLESLRIGRRTLPFVSAGGGYLRQLHEGRTAIEQGQIYHAGGGIKHWLLARNRGLVRTAGVRADARAYVAHKGIAVGESPRSHVAISGSVFLGF